MYYSCFISLFLGCLFFSRSAEATTWDVIYPTDSTTEIIEGTLRWAILSAQSGDTILLDTATPYRISLAAPLPAITQTNLTIEAYLGLPYTILGNNLYPIFSVVQPDFTGNLILKGITLTEGVSKGGDGGVGNTSGGGGGGGAGGGGNLYIHTGSHVTLQNNVSITSGKAQGGNGGNISGTSSFNAGGGGGGFGSNFGNQSGKGGNGTLNSSGGGGGGGGGNIVGGKGGTGTISGFVGGTDVVSGGGGGGGSGTRSGGDAVSFISISPGVIGTRIGGTSTNNNGGGGAGMGGEGQDATSTTCGMGGQGIGPDNYFAGGGGGGSNSSTTGGAGFGAGGGGGSFQGIGGAGGPMGGGGGGGGNGGETPQSDCKPGGNGGFGGGGGGGGTSVATSLFGGGNGGTGFSGSTFGAGGGGGAAMGGNIFVQNSAFLTIGTGSEISGGQVIGGSAGNSSLVESAAQPGNTYGPDLFVRSGGTVTFTNTDTLTISTPIASDQNTTISSGGLIMNGTGILSLESTQNTYTPNTTINAGTVVISSNGCLGSTLGNTTGGNSVILGNGTLQTTNTFSSIRSFFLTGAGTISTDPSTTFTLGSTISGSGSLTKAGAGTLVFFQSQPHTYAGSTYVTAGTLSLRGGNEKMIASSPLVSVTGATLLLQTDQTIQDLSGDSGSFLSLGANTLTFGSNNVSPQTFGGQISGTGSITKQGSGTAILTGSSNYGGSTTLLAGTLRIENNTCIGSTGFFAGGDSTLGIDYTGSFSSPITITLGKTLTIDTNDNPTITTSIIQSGVSSNTNLIKTGTGQLTLSAQSSYFGTTTIGLGGSIVLTGSSSNIPKSSLVSIQTGASLFLESNQTIQGLSGDVNSSVVFTNPALSLTFGTSNGSVPIFQGVISDGVNTCSVTKQGTDTAIFTGANTYKGGTTITAGKLSLKDSGSLYSAGTVNVGVNGTFDISLSTTSPQTIGDLLGSGSVTLGSNTLAFGTDNDQTFSGSISGSGAVVKQGASTIIFTGSNTYSGGTTISSTGTLSLQGAGSLSTAGFVDTGTAGTFDISSSASTVTIGDLLGSGVVELGPHTLAFGSDGVTSQQFSGTINDAGLEGAINKKGSDTAIFLDASLLYTGGTTISGGILSLQGSTTLDSSSPVTVNSNGKLDLSLSAVSPQTIGDLTGGGSISLGPNTLIFGTDSSSQTFSGSFDGGGSLEKQGSGTVILTGSSSYTGSFTLTEGILNITQDAALGAIGTPLYVTDTTTFQINYSDTMTHPITITAGKTLTIDTSTQSPTISASITETAISAALNKIGSGQLFLTGSNSYTGNTTISAGTLSIKDSGNLDPSGTIIVNSGAIFDIALATTSSQTIGDLLGSGSVTLGSNTLVFGTSNDQTFSGTISGSGSIEKQNSSTVIFTGESQYTGSTTISGGKLSLQGSDNIALSSLVTVDAGAVLDISLSSSSSQTIGDLEGGGDITLGAKSLLFGTNSSSSHIFSGVINDSGSVTKQNSSTAIFTGNNVYTGGTTIAQGKLSLQGSGKLDAASSVTVNSDAFFDISLSAVSPQIIGDLLGQGNVDLGSNTLKFGTISNTSFAGIISNSGSIEKQGSGIILFTNANSYTGSTTITAGTLGLQGLGSLSISGAVVIGPSGTFDISLISTLSQTIGDLTGSGSLTLGSKKLIFGTDNVTTQTFSGTISGAGSLQKQGSGVVTLSGDSSYSGGTTLSSGTLEIGQNTSIGLANSPLFVTNSATFAINYTGTMSHPITIASGKTLTLDTGSQNPTISSSIKETSSNAGLNKIGSGELILSAPNSYTGGTTITAGTLSLQGSGSLSSSGAVSVSSGATFNISLSSISPQIIGNLTGSGDVELGSNSLTFGTNNILPKLFSGVISGSGSVTKQSSGTAIFTGTNNYTGGTTITGGKLKLEDNGQLDPSGLLAISSGAVFDISSSSLPSQTIGDLTGSGSVTLGSNKLIFGTNNASSQIFSGIISGGGSVEKQNSGTAIFTGVNQYTGGTTISGGTLLLRGINGSLSSTGFVDLALGATFDMSSLIGKLHQTIGDLLGDGDVLLGPHVLSFGSDSISSQTFNGQISGLGAVIKKGSDTAIFTNTNSYASGTTVSQGTLSLQGLGSLNSSASLAINSGAVFDIALSGSSTQTVGDLTGSGTVELGLNTLAFGTNRNQTFAGVVQGGGSLIKQGSGIATFTGANLFTGDANIDAGTLAMNGSLAGGVVVNSGATLQGTGTIAGLVTVNSNGTIHPGNSIGTLTLGDLSLAPLSNTDMELQPLTSTQPTIASRIDVTNGASLDGILRLNVAQGFYPANTSYTLLTAGTALSGTWTPVLVPGSQDIGDYQILYDYASFPKTVILLMQIPPLPLIDIDLLDGNENGQHLAEYLNMYNGDPILGPVVFDLSKLSKDQLNAAMNSISPARNAIGRFVGQNTMFLMASTVSCRMSQQRLSIRDAQMGKEPLSDKYLMSLSPHRVAAKSPTIQRGASFSSSSEFISYRKEKLLEEYEDYLVAQNDSSYSPYGEASVMVAENQKYSFWAEGLGEWIYQDALEENPAYAAYTGGGLLGFDYYGEKAGLLGAAIGYAKSRIQQAHGAGKETIDFYMGSIYGTMYLGNGYVELGMAGAFNQFFNERHVTYPQFAGGNFDALATSSCWGLQFVPHIAGGYDWNFSWGTLEPFATLDCAILFQSAFSEQGASPLNMHQPYSWSGLFRSEVGLHAYELWTTRVGDFILRETLSYVNKTPYGVGDIFANILGYPPGFSLTSFTKVQNFFSPGLQFLYRAPGGGFISFSYMGEFQVGAKKYTSQNVLGQLGVYF